MFLQPVKIDVPEIVHKTMGACYLIHKFTNGNALVTYVKDDFQGNFYIIDLRDTDYDT